MSEDRRFPVEKIAKLDSPDRHRRLPPQPIVDLVAESSPTRILDIGVGTGYFALPIAARLPSAKIFALDVEPKMLEIVVERATEQGIAAAFEPVLAPADSLPLPAAAADLVLLATVYHELPDRPQYLAEIARVLTPGGRLIICDWKPGELLEAGPPEHHRIDPATVAAELTGAGFTRLANHDLYPEGFYVITAARD